MSIELKIKSKHLALEAQVIRFEENKLKKQIEWSKIRQKEDATLYNTWQSLNTHRRWDVRNENRATFLARAFIQGRPYINVEKKRIDQGIFKNYILPRVVSMVIKYKLKRIEKFMKPEDVKEVKNQILEWSNI